MTNNPPQEDSGIGTAPALEGIRRRDGRAEKKATLSGDGMTLAQIIRSKNGKKGETEMNQTMNSGMSTQSFWQLVFSQSKVNGAPYYGDSLPGRSWDWPKDTYLQRRLQQSKWFQSTGNTKVN